MADDNTLQIGIQIDVSSLRAGMDDASSVVSQSTQDMAASFEDAQAQVVAATQAMADAQAQLGAAAAAGSDQAKAVLAQYQQELDNARAKVVEFSQAQQSASVSGGDTNVLTAAYHQLAAATLEAVSARRALNSAIADNVEKQDAAAIAMVATLQERSAIATEQLALAKANLAEVQEYVATAAEQELGAEAADTAAVEQNTAAVNENTASQGRNASAVMATGAGIRLLEGNMQSANRALANFLANTLGLGPILQDLFPVIGVVALIGVLDLLAQKFQDVIASAAGFGEETQKQLQKLVAQNNDLIISNIKLRESYRDIAATGETGIAKLHSQEASIKQARAETAEAFRAQLQAQQRSQQELEAYQHGWLALTTGVLGWINGADRAMKTLRSDIVEQGDELKKLTDLQQEFAKQQAQTSADQVRQAVDDSRSIAKAKVDAAEKVEEQRISIAQEGVRAEYDLGRISLNDEINGLKEAETEKYNILKDSLAKRLALARSNPDAAAGQSEAIGIQAQQATAEQTYQENLYQIDVRGQEQRKRLEDAAAEAKIAATERVGEARVRAEQEATQQLAALHKISIADETAQQSAQENKLYEIKRSAIEQRLALEKQEPEKNRAQIIALNGELQALEVEHQAKLDSIKSSGLERQLEQDKQNATEQLRVATESANRQLEEANRVNDLMLRGHRESLSAWQSSANEALAQWYETQHQALERAMADAKRIFGQESTEYKALIDKMNQLDQQRAQKQETLDQQAENQFQRAYARMTQDVNNALTNWISGHEKFAQTFARLTDQITAQFIQNVLKMTEQWIVGLTIQKTAQKSQIMADAKTAAANTYSAVSAIPVVGPFLAPPAAAAAFAAVLAFDSFEQGGIIGGKVGTAVPVMGHAGERVLTVDQTRNFESLVSQNNSRQTGGNFNAHIEQHFHGAKASSSKEMTRAIRTLVRQGKLSFS
jgi:hypothetical protein